MKQFRSIAICLALAAISWRGLAATSPLSPEQERATFQLADTNLAIELVAAEPDVRAPVALAWDADGRMFVAEMTDYPSGPVNGRIRLLEDRDGDGRYERSTIFAANLAFPNGVMAWKNGVLVTAAPDIWFLADTNADGVADVREKILTGFSEGNQQLRVNGLFWGIDNWIYGCNGRSDGEVKWADGTRAGSIRRHDFRFRPDTKQFQVIAGNSQFGMGYDDWGNRFPVFNNTPIRHVVMEDYHLERQALLAGADVVPSISPTNGGNRVFALTPPTLLIPQAVGFFTSACGPSIFRGTALPESYRGNYFVCEPVQNVVQRRVLIPNGSTFVAEYADASDSPLPSTGRGGRGEGWQRRGASDNANAAARNHPSPSIPLPVEGRGKPEAREFLASTDRWFHGVFTATGPDGAFYIVDFYRDLVEHPHWVAPEIRDKVDWRKGEEHGRIWRVRAKDAKAAKMEKLSRASNLQLVQALESDNGWTRDTAQRLLVERNAREAKNHLEALALRSTRPATRIQAAQVLTEIGFVMGSLGLERQLADPDPRVREHAVRLAEGSRAPSGGIQDGRGFGRSEETLIKLVTMTEDPDARVRAQLASTLGVVSQWKVGGNARWSWGRDNNPANRIWYAEVPSLTRSILAVEPGDFTAALARLARHPQLDQWQATAILSSAGARPWLLLHQIVSRLENETEEQGQLLARLCAATVASTNTNDIAGLAAWIAEHRSMNRLPMAAAFVEALSPDQRAEALGRLNGVQLRLAATLACTNAAAPPHVRLAAVRLLGATHSAEAASALQSLLSRDQPEPLQVAAAKALVEWDAPGPLARRALERWPEVSKAARRQMIVSSMKNSNGPLALFDFIEPGLIAKSEIDPATRQALQKHRDQTVGLRARMIFADKFSADREAVVTKYRAALKLEGDRAHGAALFERACLVCHQMQGVGAKVGPDLSGIGQQPRETLLVQILDPSRQVLPDFMAYNATTKSGETFTGFIANESAATVTLRRANEPDVTLKRADLKEFKTSGNSLMPEGLEAGMTEQDMADLIEFLRRPDRTLFNENSKSQNANPK